MNITHTMLRHHPHADLQRIDDYTEVLKTLASCAQVCTACADACLAEENVAMLRRCIRLDLDCADVCAVTGALLVRQTETPAELLHAQLHACILACQLCADECDKHASMHDHCRICAGTCRHCQERCNFLLGEISASGVEEDAANPMESPSLQR